MEQSMHSRISSSTNLVRSRHRYLLSSLSENLLVEIFARLPSRAATRSKLVCKRWCSIISSDYFVFFFNHRRHDSSLPPILEPDLSSFSLALQLKYHHNKPCDDHCPLNGPGWINSHSAVKLLSDHSVFSKLYLHRWIDFSFIPSPRCQLKASSADLILCSFRENPQTISFYVCTLLTKQWASLPALKDRHGNIHEDAIVFLSVPAPCSLCKSHQCLDNSHYNYMIVQIPRLISTQTCSQINVQLFSSEEGEWRDHVVSCPRPLNSFLLYSYRTQYESIRVAYKGMLHWLTCECVVVYDPYNTHDRFPRVIDLPAEFQSPYLSGFGVCRDRLRVGGHRLEVIESPEIVIWELEDYNMGKWSLVHKICINNPQFRGGPLDMLCFHPDRNVVYLRKARTVLAYNFQTGDVIYETELLQHESGTSLRLSWGNAIQISNQPWPTPVPSVSLNKHPCTIQNKDNNLGKLEEEGAG